MSFHISFAHLGDQAQEMSSVGLLHSPPLRSNSPQRQKSSSPGDVIKFLVKVATMATHTMRFRLQLFQQTWSCKSVSDTAERWIDFFLLQSDYDVLAPEMQKNGGYRRFISDIKRMENYPHFKQVRQSQIEQSAISLTYSSCRKLLLGTLRTDDDDANPQDGDRM